MAAERTAAHCSGTSTHALSITQPPPCAKTMSALGLRQTQKTCPRQPHLQPLSASDNHICQRQYRRCGTPNKPIHPSSFSLPYDSQALCSCTRLVCQSVLVIGLCVLQVLVHICQQYHLLLTLLSTSATSTSQKPTRGETRTYPRFYICQAASIIDKHGIDHEVASGSYYLSIFPEPKPTPS